MACISGLTGTWVTQTDCKGLSRVGQPFNICFDLGRMRMFSSANGISHTSYHIGLELTLHLY